MPKKDFSQIAFSVVQQATGDEPKPKVSPKQENSRKGGLKGGVTRMSLLSEDERKVLAIKAASSRWNKSAPNPKTGAHKS
jgi:hypothetical protein